MSKLAKEVEQSENRSTKIHVTCATAGVPSDISLIAPSQTGLYSLALYDERQNLAVWPYLQAWIARIEDQE